MKFKNKVKAKAIDNLYGFFLLVMAFALPIYFFSLKDDKTPAPVRLTGLMVIGFAPIAFSIAFADITEMVFRKWIKCDIEKVKTGIQLAYALIFIIITFAGIGFVVLVQGWEATLETFANVTLIGVGLCVLIQLLNKKK